MAPPSPTPLTPYSVAWAGVIMWRHAHGGDLRVRTARGSRQRCGQRLSVLVERDLLIKRGADALRDAALHLAVDDHRIDHRAAILRDGVVEDLDDAGVGIDGQTAACVP